MEAASPGTGSPSCLEPLQEQGMFCAEYRHDRRHPQNPKPSTWRGGVGFSSCRLQESNRSSQVLGSSIKSLFILRSLPCILPI